MDSYTVKQISEMLKTNPETVRRWIRLGELESDQVSRKGGNLITASSLNKFLKSKPKYADIAAGTLSAAGATGVLAGISILTGALIVSLIEKKAFSPDKIRVANLSLSEIKKYIETSIESAKQSISAKQAEISKLELQIQSEQQQIQKYKNLLEKIESQINSEGRDTNGKKLRK